MYYYISKPDYSRMTEEEKKAQEGINAFNAKILDAVIDDDVDQFSHLISQANDGSDDQNFSIKITNYKLPEILLYDPPVASVCALFNAEKCFYSFLMRFPEGISSSKLKKQDKMGRSLMHFAAFGGSLKIMRELNQADYDLNEHDKTNKTPSHYSAISGTTDAMKYIWSKGIRIFYNVEFGSRTPLHMACLYGSFDVVKFIIESASQIDLAECDSYHSHYYRNLTPLHLACEGGNVDIVNYLLSKEIMWKTQIKALDHEQRSPLHIAIENGNLECVKALIKTGKAKHYYSGRRHVALIDAVIGGFKDIVFFLLKNGADIKMTNYKKLTALDEAIKNDDLDIIKLLIDFGAMKDFNEQQLCDVFVEVLGTLDFELIEFFNEKFKIPYHSKGDAFIGKAVQLESEELVNYLLAKNCNLNNIGQYVTFTSRWRPFMDFLKAKGIDASGFKSEDGVPLIIKSIKGGSLQSVKKMLSEGSKLTTEMINEYDCIMSTCIKGNRKLFNFLIRDYKPDMSKANSYLYNLLSNYREYRDTSKETKIKDRVKMANTLIGEFNASPNQLEIIREAANKGNLPILELFAKYHVDFNICDIDYNDFETPNRDAILQFLRIHGYKR